MSWNGKSELGFAHLGIIVGAVVFVGVIGLVAWRVLGTQNSSPTSSAIQQALANAKCDTGDKDICKFYASWKASASFKVMSTDVNGNQTTASNFESADSGKRFHMVTTVSGKTYEVITIDNAVYTKDNSGTWWKQTVDPAKESNYKGNYNYDFTDPETTKTEQKTTYKLIGKEACGKLTCFKYQVIDPSVAGETQYIWFDTRDYQLRRMHTDTKDGSSDQTFSYENVTINAPSPVKELSPSQTVNPETGEVITLPSQQDVQSEVQKALNGAQ